MSQIPTQRLQGKTAVVTGAASNIGRETALLLARQGAHTVCTDVDTARAQSLMDQLRAEALSAEFVAADLAQEAGAQKLIDYCAQRTLSPELFVHSAAPARLEKDDSLHVDMATFDAMLNINLRSGFLLARHFGQLMANRRLGSIVFITSLHAGTPRNLPHYSAAKAGQTALVKELARYFGGQGVRVNAVAPGAIAGGGFAVPPDTKARLEAMIPMQRLGSAADIAGAVLALCLDEFSAYITGTTLIVDGGLSLHNWIPPAQYEG